MILASVVLALLGGGGDVDEAFQAMIQAARGGSFVIIRASGADAYNPYVRKLGHTGPVETIVFRDRAAGLDPANAAKIRNAAALFIAGGDQWNYVNYWKDTPVHAAIEAVAKKGGAVGGTSAGLAVLGQYAFGARHGSVTSAQALANPYDERVALEREFLRLPGLEGIVTDSHFVERDRMGRTLAFLARIVQDGWSRPARGIAIDRATAVLVEAGTARVVGKNVAYFLRTTRAPEVCQAGAPLTIQGIEVRRLGPGNTLDLKSWTGGGAAYALHVTGGKVTSTQPGGGVY